MHEYNHQEIEQKWQQKWEEEKLNETPDRVEGKKNFYTLVEFPYPSGNLHVGHWYAFAVPDMFARFMRMRGKNVLFPIGFDAFGLPAENAAIKHGVNPREWTLSNIERMRGQLKSMGAMFDWSREVATCDPAYYRWTQWLFLQFFNRGLAYQKETEVNWCPKDLTVLANEQVVAGACERCGAEVEKRVMRQWHLKITDYAERLLKDLEKLDWPEPIKEAQRQWIGRSEGAVIKFEILNPKSEIEIFTTRPDTLFGATYLVLAPEHTRISHLASRITNWDEVQAYIEKTKNKSELERQAGKEKTGVELKGIRAVNPATEEEIPVWVADYVLPHYGTGAIMAVPAHDERDFEFAFTNMKENWKDVMKNVIRPVRVEDIGGFVFPGFAHEILRGETDEEANRRSRQQEYELILNGQYGYSGEGVLVNSDEFDGLTCAEAKEKITEKFGTKKTTYKMEDWALSRQRYWGCPIPIVQCEQCGAVAVPDEELPVVLPDVDDYLPAGDGKSPLAKVESFVNATCPKCGGRAKRETDTMDTFVDSSWHFLRYTDSKNDKEFAARERQDAWMPVDFYSGGAEHTTRHLLYARFFHKALYDFGLVKDAEPFTKRMNRGLILDTENRKMSKRWGNAIDPDAEVARLGADTVRVYLAFIGPFNEVGAYPWSSDGIVGVRRFLERIWRLGHLVSKAEGTLNVQHSAERLLHRTIKKVTDDIEALKFNTAVAALMILVNELERLASIPQVWYNALLVLLAPFAPHIAEELWHTGGNEGSVHLQPWPAYDESLLAEEEATMAVQINGKVRATIVVPAESQQAVVEEAAKADPQVAKWLAGKEVKKVIYVRNKVLNIVLDPVRVSFSSD